MSREGENRTRSAGSIEAPKDGVESGVGGVHGGRARCPWLRCGVAGRVSDSGRFVSVTAWWGGGGQGNV